jgi:AcrR family transcriptional regulator
MSRIANPSGREYRSQLRAAQAEETRKRILDATVRVIATGLANLSIPAVAREAGVSVPTVYRHFGTKADLLAALHPHITRRAGLEDVKDPRSLDELRDAIRGIFARLDALDDLARAEIASPVVADIRRATMPSRYERVRRIADSTEPKLSGADRDRVTRILLVLTMSSTLRVWRDHLGSSVDQAADDIDWIIRAGIAAAAPDDER